jgi:hypothetical protein
MLPKWVRLCSYRFSVPMKQNKTGMGHKETFTPAAVFPEFGARFSATNIRDPYPLRIGAN